MIEGNKICPLNNFQKCNKENCIFFNKYEDKCTLKFEKKEKENYIIIGFKIALGFFLFSILIAIIISLITFILMS